MSRLVIYHAGCVDGYTAAWCAWKKFGDEADYRPAQYGDPPPQVTGRDVLIVDFSYPRAILEFLRGAAASIRVLDHHKTAQSELEGLDYCTFDMSRSGAGLTWDELHGGPRPKLVDYVEDRDLWRWQLNGSREISAWIGSWSRDDFRAWSLLQSDLEVDAMDCFAQGAAILRALDQYVEGNAKHGREIELAGHRVPCINTTFATSELVGKLAESALFAVGWFQKQNGEFVYSLRSRGDFDVSEIAKRFGGGGHKNAAGFTVPELVHR